MGVPLGLAAVVTGLLATTNGLLSGWPTMLAIIAGVVAAIYTTKTKTELRVLSGAADAWRDERDAEKAKADRLEAALRDESSARKTAEARTDITELQSIIVAQHHESLAILRSLSETLTVLSTRPAGVD